MAPPDNTPRETETTARAPHASSSFEAIKRSGADAAAAARQVGRAAGEDLKEAGGSVFRDAGEGVEAAKARLGDSLHRTAGDLRNAGDGLDSDARWANEALTRGARALDSISGYLAGHRTNEMLHDGEDFARRNPAAFFAASVAAGFLVARLAKTAAARAGGAHAEDGKEDGRKGADGGHVPEAGGVGP